MSLITSAVIWVATLCWIDAAYFDGIYYNGFHTIISQMVVHY